VSGRKAKAARKVTRVQAPPKRQQPYSYWSSWTGWAVGIGVVALVAASFVVPKLVDRSSSPTSVSAHAGIVTGSERGKGLKVGASVPAFSEQNVENDQPIRSTSLYRHRTLLFFSEGVMCQACFEQIKGLEQMGSELAKRNIQLVSITPDSRRDLKQAIGQYGITTP
jgi:cytochrome oxidase Cu insertion factor (SCO1/SenC/PrrC family)